MNTEKRTAARVPVSMNVSGDETSGTLGFGYAQNISEEGLAVDAEALDDQKKLPSVGAEIRMRFKLPKSAFVITATGKIVRIDQTGKSPLIALKFLGLSPEFRVEIQKYVGASLAS